MQNTTENINIVYTRPRCISFGQLLFKTGAVSEHQIGFIIGCVFATGIFACTLLAADISEKKEIPSTITIPSSCSATTIIIGTDTLTITH